MNGIIERFYQNENLLDWRLEITLDDGHKDVYLIYKGGESYGTIDNEKDFDHLTNDNHDELSTPEPVRVWVKQCITEFDNE